MEMDSTLCLICLRSESEENYSVFDADLRTPNMTILAKIRRCSNLNLTPEENKNLPNKICSRCLDDLTASYRFIKNVERVNEKYTPSLSDTKNSDSLKELENAEMPPVVSASEINQKEGILFIENEIGSRDKQLEQEFNDVIVETISDEDLTENMEIAEYDEFESIYEEEILDEDLNNRVNSCIINSSVDNKNIHRGGNEINIQVKKEIRNTKDVNGYSVNCNRNKTRLVKKSHCDTEYKKSRTKKNTPKFTISEFTEIMDDSGSENTVICSSKELKKNYAPKICDICGNSYKYQHALNAHMRRHTNERPYRCEFCEKTFVAGVEMQRHMRVHTGQKPYSCKHCDRKFSDFGSRVKHERTHTGERPYICPTCGKTFAYAHVLTVHLRTHTGEKKFQCTLCEKGFTKKVYLQSHMLQHNRSSTTEKNYDSSEKPVKMEEYVITEYVDSDYLEPDNFVKTEGDVCSEDTDTDFKYIITVQ